MFARHLCTAAYLPPVLMPGNDGFFFLLLLLLRLMACELCLRWTMRWYFQSLSYVCCIECDRKTTPAFESILNISLSLSIMFPPFCVQATSEQVSCILSCLNFICLVPQCLEYTAAFTRLAETCLSRVRSCHFMCDMYALSGLAVYQRRISSFVVPVYVV